MQRSSPIRSRRWVEGTLGLHEEPGTGRLIRARPRSIGGTEGAARSWRSSPASRRPLRGCHPRHAASPVTASRSRVRLPGVRLPAAPVLQPRRHGLREPRGRRRTATSRPRASSSSPATATRVLLPLSFCRECGQDYYTVGRRKDLSGDALATSRASSPTSSQSRSATAASSTSATDTPVAGRSATPSTGRVPDDWLEEKADGRRVGQERPQEGLPSIVHVGPDGRESPAGLRVAWVPAPFKFCLVVRGRVPRPPDPRPRQARDPRLRRPELGDEPALAHDGPRRSATTRPSSRRAPQAPGLHRQPPGRLAPGRSPQRHRRGRPAALGTLPGRQGGGRPASVTTSWPAKVADAPGSSHRGLRARPGGEVRRQGSRPTPPCATSSATASTATSSAAGA